MTQFVGKYPGAPYQNVQGAFPSLGLFGSDLIAEAEILLADEFFQCVSQRLSFRQLSIKQECKIGMRQERLVENQEVR